MCRRSVSAKHKFLVSISLISIIIFAISIESATAFSSFRIKGGAIHEAILKEALLPIGFEEESLKPIIRGMNSQDNPLGEKWTKSENHACDNKISEAFAYIDERTKRAVELAAEGEHNRKARHKSLYSFGEALHSLQDFYSHSNYVEWLVKNEAPLVPIDREKVPIQLRTCFYMYESTFCQEPFKSHAVNIEKLSKRFPGLKFRSEEEFERRKHENSLESALDYALRPGHLLHMELNKDNEKELQGKVFSQKHNKTLFKLAYSLAVEDTQRQWSLFEAQLRRVYGDRANGIIKALKSDGMRQQSSFDDNAPKDSKDSFEPEQNQ